MARTKTYERQILNAISNTNAKMLKIERTFGVNSSQYQRYVNTITGALPASAYKVNAETGRVTISKSKANIKTFKKGQFNALKKLPTATKSIRQSKKSVAKNILRSQGYDSPSDEEIKELAEDISDEVALEELQAKNFIEMLEDEHGKLKYTEEHSALLRTSGAKTYKQLMEILNSTRGTQTFEPFKSAVKQTFTREGGFKWDIQ